MIRKLAVISLIATIFLLGTISTLAAGGHAEIYGTLAEYEALTGKTITEFSQAPMLRTMVAAGDLPPLEERLPVEVLVIEPTEEIGQYGGTWHKAWVGDPIAVEKALGDGHAMLRWSWDGRKVMPNLVTRWEVLEDAKVFTFTLRKGVKWSDGVPFTTDDVMFYWEDVVLNEELTPVYPNWLSVEGQRPEVEALDEYTFRFTFPVPYPTFIEVFTSGFFYQPKHYAQQFHINYASAEKVEQMTKEAGFDHWYQLYAAKTEYAATGGWWVTNPDHPTLWAWQLKIPREEQQMVYERNPYYWKVDTAGNQLPYIDKVTIDMVQDAEMVNFKAMTGELDFQQRGIAFPNYTLLMENREKGDYRILTWKIAFGSNPFYHLNLTHTDPVLRQIFQDVRFRKALSLAINRDEINELVYLGTGEPRQASIVSGALYYSEKWATSYAEYDPERANAFLDEMGLSERDKDGFRLRPDGKTLLLSIDMNDWYPE